MQNKAGRSAVAFIVLFATGFYRPAFSHETNTYTASLMANANQQAVFKAIQDTRSVPGCRKLISYNNNRAIIETSFDQLPIIGSAQCTYQETETSPSRIDYALISSDKLSKFEGAWTIEGQPNGRSKVTLSSETECAIKMPFAQKVINQIEARQVGKRLQEIAHVAENSGSNEKKLLLSKS